MRSVDSLTIDPKDRASLLVGVLDLALTEVQTKGARPDISIAGLPAAEPSLRRGLETVYRELAGYAETRQDKVRLVDQANSVRNWTRQ
jgi:serine/threonine-protein kinase PknG